MLFVGDKESNYTNIYYGEMIKMVLRLMKLIAGSVFVIALAACGGGGGGDPSSAPGVGDPPAGGSEPTESSDWGSMTWDNDAWG